MLMVSKKPDRDRPNGPIYTVLAPICYLWPPCVFSYT
jgi:hypothetical protein